MFSSLIKLILHQPLLDLVERPEAQFFANAAARSATALLDDATPAYPLWVQRRGAPGLLEALRREVQRPADDGTRWPAVDAFAARWPTLDVDARIKLARVLLQAGAYERVAALLDTDDAAVLDPRLALLDVSVRVGLHRAGGARPAIGRLAAACERVLADAPSEEIEVVAVLRAFLLSLQYGGEADAARDGYERAIAVAESLERAPTTFRRTLMASCLWRATAMWPHARGELDRMAFEMAHCEVLAGAVEPTDATEVFLGHENLFSVHESRTKERLACRDLVGAEQHAQRLVDLFPFDPTARIELGEVLLRAGRPAEAALQYELAAEYGPPGGAVAWFMAGEAYAACAAAQGSDPSEARALTAYLASQRLDPLAISAVQRAAENSRRGAGAEREGIGNWCTGWLDEAEAVREGALA